MTWLIIAGILVAGWVLARVSVAVVARKRAAAPEYPDTPSDPVAAPESGTDAPPDAAPVRTDAPAAWRHEILTHKIGRNYYSFRTLSIADAAEVFRFIPGLQDAIARGDAPIQYMQHAIPILKVICPSIITIGRLSDLKAVTPLDIKVVWEFYRGQDWARMTGLQGKGGLAPAAEREDGGPSDRMVFMHVCSAAAESVNMDFMAFLDARFEFCADAIAALRVKLEQQPEGQMTADQFAATSAAMFGENRVNSVTAPGWLKAMVSHATGGRVN